MNDYIVRAISDDKNVRAFSCYTKGIVDIARNYHNLSPVSSALLGRLLSAASMMGYMLKGENDTITLQMTGNGPCQRALAVSDASGDVRGYVQNGDVYLDLNEKGKLDVGGAIGKDGYLTVISDLGLKEPYIGKIPLVTGEVGDDLAQYFYVSEQVASVVALGVLVDKDLSIKASGGMIIQLLPGASEEIINIIEENIKKIQSVTTCFENSKTPEDLIEMALSGIDFHFTDKKEISYRCNCSETRVRNVLKSVGKTELEAIIKEDGKAELCCQFCDKKYNFDMDDLNKILDELNSQEENND